MCCRLYRCMLWMVAVVLNFGGCKRKNTPSGIAGRAFSFLILFIG